MKDWKRRDFLGMLAALTGAGFVAPVPGAVAAGANSLGDGPRSGGAFAGPRAAMTIQQVIDALLADIPGAPFPNTVDTIKAGDPGQAVKGIVTTMFATDAVIEKTISLGGVGRKGADRGYSEISAGPGDLW
jgi:hypothetical protein